MSALKVSLPPHLREVLEPLKGLLPPELDEIVVQSLGSTEILYDTLSNVSKWAFSDEGRAILKEKELDPQNYSRIALLAGTVTAPSARLPPPEPKPEPWEIAQEEKSTRRAIAALVNGLFSMLGVGVAVYWASKTAGWTYEMRVLSSVLAGLFTGLVEASLFAIYYNKRENARLYRERQRQRKKERQWKRYLKEKGADNGDVASEEKTKDEENGSSDEGNVVKTDVQLEKYEESASEGVVPVDFAGANEEDDNGLRRRVIAEIIDEDGD